MKKLKELWKEIQPFIEICFCMCLMAGIATTVLAVAFYCKMMMEVGG